MLDKARIVFKTWLADVGWFSRLVIRRPLYGYQLEPARAIVASVLQRKGLEFAVMFPRQSGKNETQSQVEAYLLNLFQRVPGAEIVKAQPTLDPQGLNAVRRLRRALDNRWNQGQWRTRGDFRIELGQAAITFLSAQPRANAAGATASLLLECDEAQDVLEAEWEKKFIPMGASTNATVVYWGTAWTSRTLLAKVIRQLRALELHDGVKRVFVVTPEQVARENAAYGDYVARQVAKQGRQHPLVRTQFFNEEIDAEGGMFPPARQAAMRGSHCRRHEPDAADAARPYALLLDVAGEDEGASDAGGPLDPAALDNPRRDSTVLTVVEVDLTTRQDPVIAAPTYRCVDRCIWTGIKHPQLYGQLLNLARHWRAQYLVADATGVGAGLVSFLQRALRPEQVIPFTFSSASKSQLGWDFLAICDAGRWQDWQADGGPLASDADSALFFNELTFCQHAVMPGPARLLKWGVPDGTRDYASGELVHDDLIMSAALCAVLDAQNWHIATGPTSIIRGKDPLDEMSRGY